MYPKLLISKICHTKNSVLLRRCTKKELLISPLNIWDQFTYNVVTIIKLFWLALSHNIFLLSSLKHVFPIFSSSFHENIFTCYPLTSEPKQFPIGWISLPVLSKNLSHPLRMNENVLYVDGRLHNIFVFNKQISFSLHFIVRRCGLKISLCP